MILRMTKTINEIIAIQLDFKGHLRKMVQLPLETKTMLKMGLFKIMAFLQFKKKANLISPIIVQQIPAWIFCQPSKN